MKKIKRTLVCCQRIIVKNGTQYLEIIVPSWHLRRRIFIPVTLIPQKVLQRAKLFPDNRLRFLAKVDLHSRRRRDVAANIHEFENLCLLDTFKEK
jgi:hypothetical protein